jgi:hypothetical protein
MTRFPADVLSRQYSSDDVSPDTVRRLISMAVMAPSAHNRQPWPFVSAGALRQFPWQGCIHAPGRHSLDQARCARGDRSYSGAQMTKPPSVAWVRAVGCCKHLVLDVELQQNRRMIRRAADRLRIDPATKIGQIQFLNKDVDHPNGIVLADPIFQAFRKQRALPRPTRIGMSRS